MKKLLVIGYVWPEPKSSAAGSRMIALLESFLSAGYWITFTSPAEKTAHMAALGAMGITSRQIALNCGSFDLLLRELNPDVVLFDRFMLEEQFGWRVENACPDALRILDTEDLFCLRHHRHRLFRETGKIETAVSPDILDSELTKREIAAILRCDLSLIISEAEMALLQDLFAVDPSLLLYLPFMRPPARDIAAAGFEQRRHFVSIGNFRHPPNWDAVLFLKETLWPGIRARLPGAELHIYGAYPPKKATQLQNPKQGFWVKGWAEDVARVMTTARVNLAPLRFGAGLKGKLADAMALGTPSVTTSVGAEGMAADAPWPGAICDEPDAFIDAAVALYTNQALWLEKHHHGIALHNDRFDDNHHRARLLSRIESLHSDLTSRRIKNFTGAMLRHHRLRSTQYMSQWIEVKNRLKALEADQPPESRGK